MKRFFNVMAIAVLVITASCSKNDEVNDPKGTSKYVTIAPDIIPTKATTTNFEYGDKIGLTIVKGQEEYVSNAELTFADEKFAGKVSWYEDQSASSTLMAYYPYTTEGFGKSFTIQADQTGVGFAKSDYMVAVKDGVLPTIDAVKMEFKHALAQLVCEIDNQSGFDITGITFNKVIPTTQVKFPELTTEVIDGVEPISVKAKMIAENKYAANVPAQKVALNVDITLSNGEIISKDLTEVDLLPGHQYKISITYKPSVLTVFLSGDILAWIDGGEISVVGEEDPGDEPEELNLPEVEEHLDEGYIIYKDKYTVKQMKDGKIWMTQNLRLIPGSKQPSSDPTDGSGIWYPAANESKTADPTQVDSLGLLYDAATAFGVQITKDNADKLAGTRGICPEGWHIPTAQDIIDLVGYCYDFDKNVSAPYYDGKANGSVDKLNEDGFNLVGMGYVKKNSVTATASYEVTKVALEPIVYGGNSFIWGSTLREITMQDDEITLKNIAFYSLQIQFSKAAVPGTPDTRTIKGSGGNFLCGYSIRCVRNETPEK